MSNITTKREKAIKLIKQKISLGESIYNNIHQQITDTEYEKIIDEIEIWIDTTSNILKQIFSDERLSKFFLGDEDSFSSDEVNKITDLKHAIKNYIKRLEQINKELEEDLYDKPTNPAKWGFWQTIIVALITASAGILTGYLARSEHSRTYKSKEEKASIALEGKWKYICTSFDGTYRHGGRFIAQKEGDGSFVINGERMWKDTKKFDSDKWENHTFPQSKYAQWHTNWILIRNNCLINFEYEMPASKTLGYCSGIINSENGKVGEINGQFYVLNEIPVLHGNIKLVLVTAEQYNDPTPLAKDK